MRRLAAMRCLLLVGLLVGGAQAYAPIQWMKFPAGNFVLTPRGFPSKAIVSPEALTIKARPGKVSPGTIPYFTAKLDKTISWRNWCIESADVVRINHCTGRPAQKWNLVDNGHGNIAIQLKGTSKCLDVIDKNGFNGASVELRECADSATESWRFEEPVVLNPQGSSQHPAHSSYMRHLLTSSIVLAGIAALSVSALLRRRQKRSRLVAQATPLKLDAGGVSLSIPLSMHETSVPLSPNKATPGLVPVVMVQSVAPSAEPAVESASGKAVGTDVDPWFDSALAVRPDTQNSMIDELRDAACATLATAKRPSRKDEAWRRMDLTFLDSVPTAARDADVAEPLARVASEASEGMRLVLRDGEVDAALSDLSALPAGVQVGGLESLDDDIAATAVEALRELPETNSDPRTELGANIFAALNQASMADVACVHVPAGVKLERPLSVYVISSSTDGGLALSHPNVWVKLGEGASMTLEQHQTGNGLYFVNALTRIDIGAGAALTHVYLQEQSPEAVHVENVMVDLKAEANYKAQVIQSGSHVGRINLGVGLHGTGAKAEVQGLALGGEDQLLDTHSQIHHACAGCESRQEQRQAASDKARIVFKGGILVPKGSDQTTAKQLCRTLLLSDHARVDACPTLDIRTDDVQCSHGATISELDDEMIFYLQSRGIGREEARMQILIGWVRQFMNEVGESSIKERIAAKAADLASEDADAVGRAKNAKAYSSI